MSILDNIIGVEEAAFLTGLSAGTIKNYCAEGKIAAKKIGKTWVLDKNNLNYFKESVDMENKDIYNVKFKNNDNVFEVTVKFPMSITEYNELDDLAAESGIDINRDLGVCEFVSGNYEPRFAEVTRNFALLNSLYDYPGDYEETIIYHSLDGDEARRFKEGHLVAYLEDEDRGDSIRSIVVGKYIDFPG